MTSAASSQLVAPRSAEDEARVAAALDLHFDSVWRALRRLGVHASSADDENREVVASNAELLNFLFKESRDRVSRPAGNDA